MLKKLKSRVGNRFVTRIICICVLTASVMIVLQSLVIALYVTKYQQRQAIDSSYQVLSVAEEYFTNLYNKLKAYNTQLYKEEMVRYQVQLFARKEGADLPADRVRFQKLLSDQLLKSFGSDYDALIQANYYDLETQSLIPFYWTDEVQQRERYVELAIGSAEQAAQLGAAKQRIYELPVLSDDAARSTLTLYDFVRDPDDLSHVLGVLMFHYAVDKITERLYSMGFDDDMEVILVSQQGELCYDSLHNFSGRASEFSGKTPTPGVYTMDGVQVVRYNNRFGFYAISTIGKHALYRSVYKMLLFVILCTFAVLALLIFLLFEYERRISRRMQELADDILKIESGRLDVVLPETKHHDEIDIFAHNLNEMQRRLADQLESEKRGLEKQRQLELLQKDAEFYALQAQIKPHFLFNTLEVIRMRAVTEHAADTAVMVRLLADVIRENVNRQSMTTVAEAVNYCEKYVELFSYRFGGELIVDFQVDPPARRCYVPTYVLQPILENALTHGLRADMENPALSITVRMQRAILELCVTDNGCGMDAEKLSRLREKIESEAAVNSSIGISNVNNRLRLLFGKEYGVRIESAPGSGTRVTVRIPAITSSEELENYV